MEKRIYLLLATFFGSGLSKIAPGTIGSLATLPLAFILAYFYGTIGIVLGVLISFTVGVFVIKEILKNSPHDPGFIVIDETAEYTDDKAVVTEVNFTHAMFTPYPAIDCKEIHYKD